MAATTYTLSKTLAATEVYSNFQTDDISDATVLITLTTTQDTIVLPQYSTDSGSTWKDHEDGVYNVNSTTNKKRLSIPSGILRLLIANNSTSANAVSGSMYAETIDTGTVSTDDVYNTAGIDESVVPRAAVLNFILDAEAEAQDMVGRPMTTETVTEEEYTGNNKKTLHMHNSPMLSVTSLSIGGTSVTVTYLDILKVEGAITLTNSAEVQKFTLPRNESPEQEDRNVIITYVYGTTVSPRWLTRLATCVAAIMTLTNQTGGTYNDITSFQIGDYQASLGEPWTNINRTVQNLKEEIQNILRRRPQAPAVY